MGATERRKGVRGEHEVAELYRSRGFTIRGLEGAGDHLVVCGENSGVLLHSEVKRQEVARPWLRPARSPPCTSGGTDRRGSPYSPPASSSGCSSS
jgi:hypothetical protein